MTGVQTCALPISELIKLSGRDLELRAGISKNDLWIVISRGSIARNDFSSPTYTKDGHGERKDEFQEFLLGIVIRLLHNKEVVCHDYT